MPRVTRRLALAAILVLALPMAAPVAAKDPAKAGARPHRRVLDAGAHGISHPARLRQGRREVRADGAGRRRGGGGAVTGASWTAARPILARSGKVFFTLGSTRHRVLGLGRERLSSELLARADRWPLCL